MWAGLQRGGSNRPGSKFSTHRGAIDKIRAGRGDSQTDSVAYIRTVKRGDYIGRKEQIKEVIKEGRSKLVQVIETERNKGYGGMSAIKPRRHKRL